jgi:hypothetical protein
LDKLRDMFTPFPKEEHVPYQPKQEEHAKKWWTELAIRISDSPGPGELSIVL